MRTERDSMGEMQVPDEAYYGVQSCRSLNNFDVAGEVLPLEIIYGMVRLKWACALANRRLAIKKELEESLRLKTEAQARYEELERKIAAFDDVVREMVDDVQKQCKVESERAERRARETAESIVATAERTIAEETEKARHDLRRETVDLAVTMAGEALRGAVSAADQQRLADGYLERIAEDAGA